MGTSTSAARLGSFASPYVVHLVREITDTLFTFVFVFFSKFCTIRHHRNEVENASRNSFWNRYWERAASAGQLLANYFFCP